MHPRAWARTSLLAAGVLTGCMLLWRAAAGGSSPVSLPGLIPASLGGAPRVERLPVPAAPTPPRRHRVPGNLALNSSFEEDWHNSDLGNRRRFWLLHASDLGVGQADGHPDHWHLAPPREPATWDTEVARSGSRSLRFDRPGSATHLARLAGEQNDQSGGAHYSRYLTIRPELAGLLARRPIIVGAWCRTRDVPDGAALTVTASLLNHSPSSGAAAKVEASATFSAGTHEWEYREVRFPADVALPGTPTFVRIDFGFPGRGGTAWLDDVSLRDDPLPTQANLLPNAGFESAAADGWPGNWGPPEIWTWMRTPYYSFTGWSHGKGAMRGGARPDSAIAHSGGRSLRLTVFPGDNLAVPSAPVPLAQDRARPLEVRAMVRGDRLRSLEIMAQDETGAWLPQGDLLGDAVDDEGDYEMATTGSGTYDWQCVRKYFSPKRPVASLRLFLCARGFDGVYVPRNEVGTVWFDDLQLFEHGRTGQPTALPRAQTATGWRVEEFEPGERLWGRNTARVWIRVSKSGEREAWLRGQPRVRLTGPEGSARIFDGKSLPTSDPRLLVVTVPYEIDRLCRGPAEQYRLSFQMDGGPAGAAARFEVPFGTPAQILRGGVSGHYIYPREVLIATANVNVARESIPSLERSECVIERGGKPVRTLRLDELSKLHVPRTGPDFLPTDRLLQVKVEPGDFPVHPWSAPVADHTVRFRLYARGRAEPLAETVPEPFCFLQPPSESGVPKQVARTTVDDRGYLRIDEQPFFPVFWTPHFGILPEATWPPRTLGLKTVDLTGLVLSRGKQPDETTRAAVVAAVRAARADPALFDYALGEGEMQLQGPAWRQRKEWLETAMAWIRAEDPHHVIGGPESWLVGHPGHNVAMREFMGRWDVVGVETSFEAVPQIRAARAGGGRPTAVLVGLETYYYQPNEVIRWRGYRSAIEGAAGVGLCPSGMLESRPDKINFLRGLNAEFRRLAPVLTAPEPADRCLADAALIDWTERVHERKRYLVAARQVGASGSATVRVTLPPGTAATEAEVLFEGRVIPVKNGSFVDEFPTAHSAHVYVLR